MGTSPKAGEELERKQKLSLYFRGTSEVEGVNTPRNFEPTLRSESRGRLHTLPSREEETMILYRRNFEF